MVRRIILVLAAAAWTSPVVAQTADWSRAGGSLFAGVEIEATEPNAQGNPDIPTPPSDDALVAPAEQPYAEAVGRAAERHGLDPKLLHALVVVESAYRPGAVSRVGAAGLTQLMPGTAAELGVDDPMNPVESLRGGAAYLAQQVVRFGDLRLALAAYNAGPGRVARLGRIPDITETRDYVAAVVDCYLALSAGRGVRSARDCNQGGGAR